MATAAGYDFNPEDIGQMLGKFWSSRKPKAPERPYLDRDDPMGQLARYFKEFGGVGDLFDPGGSPHLLAALKQLFAGEGAARQRGARLAARRGSIPGLEGYGELMADLGTASDLSRSYAGALPGAIEGNQRNRLGMLNALLGEYGAQERARQGYGYEKDLIRERGREARKLADSQRRTAVNLGGWGFEF